MKTEIVPNDNPKEREDRSGRVHVSNRRTFVLLVDDEFVGEYRTKREARDSESYYRSQDTQERA